MNTALIENVVEPGTPFVSLHHSLKRLAKALKVTQRIEISSLGDFPTAQAGFVLAGIKTMYPRQKILGSFDICVISGCPVKDPGTRSDHDISGNDSNEDASGENQNSDIADPAIIRAPYERTLANPFFCLKGLNPSKAFSLRHPRPASQLIPIPVFFNIVDPGLALCHHDADRSGLWSSTMFGRENVFVLDGDTDLDHPDDTSRAFMYAALGANLLPLFNNITMRTSWRIIGTAKTEGERAREQHSLYILRSLLRQWILAMISVKRDFARVSSYGSDVLRELEQSLEDGSAIKYEPRAEEGDVLCPVCRGQYLHRPHSSPFIDVMLMSRCFLKIGCLFREGRIAPTTLIGCWRIGVGGHERRRGARMRHYGQVGKMPLQVDDGTCWRLRDTMEIHEHDQHDDEEQTRRHDDRE